jgi:CRISPR-associated protein Cas2
VAHGRRRYLVAYDIRDPKRLRKVHKTMLAFGWSMQYSVFLCDLDRVEFFSLETEIAKHIHHGVDSVAMVDLGDPSERGRQCFTFLGAPPTLPSSGPIII